MNKDKKFLDINGPLDENLCDENDALSNATLDLLDNITLSNPCVECGRSQHLVEAKVSTYKISEINKSQAYNCGHCDYNKKDKKDKQ